MKHGTLRKVLSLIMAIAMVLTLLPVGALAADAPTALYLVPNSNWKADNARFAMTLATEGWASQVWVDMTDADGDGYYEGVIPDDGNDYTIVIFCRMNPDTTENSWDNKWNQTADLTVPADEANCYTVADGAWDKGDGTWSTYTPTTDDGEEGVESDTEDSAITVYFRNDWLWPEVYVHYWKSADETQTTEWPGVKMTFVETITEGDVYSTEIPTWADTIIFNGLENGNASNRQQTPNVTGFADGSAYYIHWDGENKCSTFTYTPSTGDGGDSGEAAEPVEPVTTVTIHYRNTGVWNDVNYHAWIENGDNDTGLTTWPGTKLTENAEHKNWYTVTLSDLNAANGIGILFNSGSGSQTGDIMITANGEYWYDGELLTEAPDTWADGTVKTVSYAATLHFANAFNWGSVYLYTWTESGAYPTGAWAGTAAGLDADGFYSLNFTYEAPEGQGLNFIFSGGGQTADLKLDASAFTKGEDGVYRAEKWVVPTTTYDDNGTTKYYADIVDAPGAIAISPVVNGTSVTFEYKNEDATSVQVFGTMGMAEGATDWVGYAMTKNEYGVWSVTLNDVAYGIHQYKFVVDGTWIIDPINNWIITENSGNQNSAFLISNPESDTNTVKINVHYDAPSTEWNVCAWGADGLKPQYDFTDGVTTITLNGRASQYVCFKVRKSIEGNDWAEQSGEIRVDLANIVSGTIDVYVGSDFSVSQSLNDDVVTTNKVSSVELDYDKNTIAIHTTKTVNNPETAFSIYKNGEIANIIQSITASGSTYTLTLTETLDLVTLYQYTVRFSGQVKFADYDYKIGINTVYASAKFGDDFTYEGDDLGATWSEDSTTFRVWAPTAAEVKINLYASGTAGTDDLSKQVEMTASDNGTWVATVEGDLNKTYYTYSVTRDGETVEAVDPYARTTGVNGKRGMVIDLDSTDPEDWANDTDPNPLKSYTDAIIYELHVRDFSIDDSSGVKDEWQGKFLALTETGTTSTDGTTVTGLDYLKNLGITHLHLLPVYDYASVDETTCSTFNWGYDPLNYNVPEGSYSTDPHNGEVRVEEFKEMVSTLHDNDISVIMDVVYNHVYDAGAFSMNQIVPGYFSRQNADGSYSNGSGCGNDTASEREMVRKYIVDSVNYWADEYHVDGFRFDLVGLLDATTINEIVDTVHVNHPGALFYGEGWTLGTAVEPGNTMATQANSSATPEFAYFSDTMRNLLGGQNGTSLGFVSGLTGQEEAVANNFMARPWWTSNPTQIIQYASCHDNYTLVDKLILSTGRSEIDDEVIKMNNLAAAIYMTSQGIPFIHAGEEFLREKLEEDGGRCENSYNAPDSVNKIVWSKLEDETNAKNSAYYKGLIEFRKAHPALRFATTAEVTANVKYEWVTYEVVKFIIDGKSLANETAETIVVIFNATKSTQNVTLPSGEWTVNINGTGAGTASLGTVTGSVSVDGISAMVLTQDKKPIEFQGTNIKLEETLKMFFYLNLSDLIEGEQYYAVVTRDSANDEEDSTETISIDKWEEYETDQIRIPYTGLPARAMTDALTVTTYAEDGTKVSEVREDSIQAYAMRMLKKEEAKDAGEQSENLKTVLVDMLNYGAEAQNYFGYNESDLANAKLSDTQKDYASKTAGFPENSEVTGASENYKGTTISLKNELMMTLYFENLTDIGYAEITYTTHGGSEISEKLTYDGSETDAFYEPNETMIGVDIMGIAAADGMQSITCKVYNKEGKEIATATDSIANYLSRMQDQDDVYAAVMKFVSSAYAYFENPNK
ncbi:MAG: type I pullulanase [Oscillospiraceae bacterium]|nr:type I pullulanase [Oscillospiraceae bacterium]